MASAARVNLYWSVISFVRRDLHSQLYLLNSPSHFLFARAKMYCSLLLQGAGYRTTITSTLLILMHFLSPCWASANDVICELSLLSPSSLPFLSFSQRQYIQPGDVWYQWLQRCDQPSSGVYPRRRDLQGRAAAVRGWPDPAHPAADDSHTVQWRKAGGRRISLAVSR